jgi:hypothetical protein
LWGIAVGFTSSAVKADYCASLQAELASLNQAARSPALLQRQLQDAQNQASQAARQRRGKQPKMPDAAAAGEMPANLDPGARSAEASGDVRVNAEGLRTVGPAYYYEPSYLASTGAELAKLAKPDVPIPPVMSTDDPPVAASILPNPIDFFRKNKSAPPPEPDAEPAD